MLGVAVLVIGGLLAEHFVVTDRKLITQTLDTAAAAVEGNNSAPLARLHLARGRKRSAPIPSGSWAATVQTGKIYHLDIKINRLTSPPTAKVHFLAFGEAKDRQGLYSGATRARWTSSCVGKMTGGW